MGNLNVDQLHKGWTKLHTSGSSASRKNLHNTMLKRGGAIGDAYKTFIAKNPHLDPSQGVSVKQATKAQVTDKVKAAAREKLAAKAYGATKGTKVGGEYGSGEMRDTVVPLSKDQHDKVKAAERAAKVTAAAPSVKKKPEAKPAAMPAPKKPLSAAERIAAIAKAVRKQKSKFDVPTHNPDDIDHDDMSDMLRSLRISGKSNQFDEEKEPRNEREANEKMKPTQSKETQRLLHLAKIAATAKYRVPKKQAVAEGNNDTVYPNAKVIKSKNGKEIGEIYKHTHGWGCLHYKADNGADGMRSSKEALEHLKYMHDEHRQNSTRRMREEAEQSINEVSHATYHNIIAAAEKAHNEKRKGEVKRILWDADTALLSMKDFKRTPDPKVKARHDKLKKLYKEEVEQIDETFHGDVKRAIISTGAKHHSSENQIGARVHWFTGSSVAAAQKAVEKIPGHKPNSVSIEKNPEGLIVARVHKNALSRAGVDQGLSSSRSGGPGSPYRRRRGVLPGFPMREEAEQIDEANKTKYNVRLETGPLAGDHHEYKIAAGSENHAVENAIKKHRSMYPYHKEDMLRKNVYVNGIRKVLTQEEVEQIDEGDAADLFGKIPPRHLQKIRNMDKGSMTGGKDKMKTRLEYLKALHAHQRKYGIDTLKTKEQIGKINRTLVQMGEEVEQDETMEKVEMAQTQLHFIAYAADEILEYIEKDGEIEEWYQNKLSKVHSDMESLFSYVEGEKRRTGMVAENSPGWMIKASPLLAAAAKKMQAKQKQERAIANSPPSKPAEDAPFSGPYSDRIQSSKSRVKKLARSAMNAAIKAKKGKVSEAITRVVNRKFKNHVNTDPKLMEPSDKEVVGSDKKGMSRTEKINIGKYAQRT